MRAKRSGAELTRVNISLKVRELEEIDRCAKAAGVTRSAYVVDRALGGHHER